MIAIGSGAWDNDSGSAANMASIRTGYQSNLLATIENSVLLGEIADSAVIR